MAVEAKKDRGCTEERGGNGISRALVPLLPGRSVSRRKFYERNWEMWLRKLARWRSSDD